MTFTACVKGERSATEPGKVVTDLRFFVAHIGDKVPNDWGHTVLGKDDLIPKLSYTVCTIVQ